MRNFANAKGWIVDDFLKDIGSGLNYKRKNWNELLELAQKREIQTVLISHKDRFVPFGFEWFEGSLQKCGVEMVIVNNETLSPQEELVQDLISIIHVFFLSYLWFKKIQKEIERDNEL